MPERLPNGSEVKPMLRVEIPEDWYDLAFKIDGNDAVQGIGKALRFYVNARRDKPSKPDRAKQYIAAGRLLVKLLANGPLSFGVIASKAEGAGISVMTLRRAKDAAGVRSVKGADAWYWELVPRKDATEADVL